jgi:hypothetical protein
VAFRKFKQVDHRWKRHLSAFGVAIGHESSKASATASDSCADGGYPGTVVSPSSVHDTLGTSFDSPRPVQHLSAGIEDQAFVQLRYAGCLGDYPANWKNVQTASVGTARKKKNVSGSREKEETEGLNCKKHRATWSSRMQCPLWGTTPGCTMCARSNVAEEWHPFSPCEKVTVANVIGRGEAALRGLILAYETLDFSENAFTVLYDLYGKDIEARTRSHAVRCAWHSVCSPGCKSALRSHRVALEGAHRRAHCRACRS